MGAGQGRWIAFSIIEYPIFYLQYFIAKLFEQAQQISWMSV